MSQSTPPGDGPGITAEERPSDGTPPLPRRLTKRKDGEVIDGVCSGLGAYLGVDPVLVRLGFVAAVFAGGAGILAYIVCMVIIPEDPGEDGPPAVRRAGHERSPQFWVGIGLIVLAAAILAGRFDLFDGGLIFPLVLIGVGIALWRTSGRDGDSPSPPDRPPEGGAPGDTAPPAAARADLPPLPVAARTPTEPPPLPRERSAVGRVTVALALVVTGVLLALDRAGILAVSVVELLAVALIVVGGGLVVATWWGRGRGLIPIGLVLVLATATAGFATRLDVPLAAGVGERLERPTTVADLGEPFELSIGHLVLDLTELEGVAIASVVGRVGMGQLEVRVPDDADVVVDATAGAGQLELFGTEYVGAPSVDRRVEVSGDGDTTLELRLSAGLGQVVVEREGDALTGLAPDWRALPAPRPLAPTVETP